MVVQPRMIELSRKKLTRKSQAFSRSSAEAFAEKNNGMAKIRVNPLVSPSNANRSLTEGRERITY